MTNQHQTPTSQPDVRVEQQEQAVASTGSLATPTLSFSVESVASILPMETATRDRLQSARADNQLDALIESRAFLVFPYGGHSLETISAIKVAPGVFGSADLPGAGSTTPERFIDVGGRFSTHRPAYWTNENPPAWVAFLLRPSLIPNELANCLTHLAAPHVAAAALISHTLSHAPLRGLIEGGCFIPISKTQQVVVTDSLGRNFPQYRRSSEQPGQFERNSAGNLIPETTKVVVGCDFENQYWLTSTSATSSDRYNAKVIIGSCQHCPGVLTEQSQFDSREYTARLLTAKGFVFVAN